MDIRDGLTFDDVLLVPKYSDVTTRSQTDLSTKLSRNIRLNIPFISANMDTVTEASMAVAMARTGGIGIIHRFLTIQEESAQVLKVKRSGSVIIENPYMIPMNSTVRRAYDYADEMGVSGLLATDDDGRLKGIVTDRDFIFCSDDNMIVADIMTRDVVTTAPGTSAEDAKRMLRDNRVEKLPIVDDDGYIRGLFTSKDIANIDNYPMAAKDSKGRPMVGAAVGVKGDFMERTEALLEAEVDVIVVDIAHGHSQNAIRTVKNIKKAFPDCEIIAGNVATASGTLDLIRAGVDAVKVGVGSGSICITRVITGSGVPQLTAVIDCARIGKDYDIPIISDGGTRTSGDATKALAAGASTVMLGSILGGTDESPGTVLTKNNKRYKVYRGMASLAASIGRKTKETGMTSLEDDLNDYVAEGVEAMVPYKGSVTDILKQLTGGIRSGLSYCGAHTIKTMQDEAEFIKMSRAGFAESQPHDVSVI
ncbi:MAG: IMP dehydrogenase [Cenarchaeum sp. SB0665_bin_23]|nr:IMP dehydrogenase [Cenarchaeum sp. SB0667_bin_13]MXY37502.1 IMP dehydrogenase [Cenarchaeum sp. SB0664_bin_35]MXY60868.1 IMP dehydrogenase [Cenarchaeum sp. SB0665_bin_23]MXZ93671.1 IMP dehydrogenase [Cenarchaeum sp. SB0666_bin_15]MYB46505.1 IMP dehydrogenase [Cenarchaeum sp. SB0662_bin_33]MYC80402.1 IMP dehydrogenase [Cenarchaeum sp. SB0661_bin_35]MYD59041.1 IMP dehydrogenase [Cenarchaeum sp. SB0678_bin_8]MYG32785.1 IMP dehydrogenase [Cenarchaeum sp. SB0677_bin_16]MYI51848.1 IMP dehydroge